LDWVNPDAFIAASIGLRSSGVNLIDIPGERAFALAIFGLPAFFLIK